MDIAVEEAIIAFNEGNVPVGAVIVNNGKIISRSHNTKNTTNISINHAELLCITEACKCLNTWYLNDCELYVTLKPCDMCSAAIAESRIKKVYYLLNSNYDDNMLKSIENINFLQINDNFKYNELLSNFFKMLRN